MRTNKFLVLTSAFFAFLVFTNCDKSLREKNEANKAINSKIYNEGLAIVDDICISCHAPELRFDNRIAPPLIAVKEHYLENSIEESEFINSMAAFLMNPMIEHSKMPGAIEKFNLMPILGMSKEQYVAAATYIYQADIEKPDWFQKHHKKEKKRLMKHTEEGAEDYLKKGMVTALATKAILGKNLLGAINAGGSVHAVEFCNERAIVLSDSMALSLNSEIKRVSDKNRNPDNEANPLELEYIHQVKSEISKSGKAIPKIQEIDNQIVGYYPIMTNNMCLQCHGNTQSDIDSKTLVKINKLYPEDKATGYSINELRGIWVIKMVK